MRRSFPKTAVVLLLLAACVALVFAEKTCPSCGASNSDNAKFCKSCGAKLPEAPPPRPAPPRVSGYAAVSGSVVTITSQPAGAGVDVDGRNRGRTPLELTDLAPGRHEYTLSRSGYRDYYGEFTIAGLFGSIVVTSDPVGAEIIVDSQPRGQAGENGLALNRVPYGKHEITARLQGYVDVVKTVDLKSSGPIGVTFRLGYGKGFLRIESEPTGAFLFVNERQVGKTPYTAEVAPSSYSLRMSRRGFYDWSGSAEVQFSESTAVHAILDRMERRQLPFLVLGLASLGTGAVATLMGESNFKKYQAATTPEDARRYHNSTFAWDIGRDVAFGAGVALTGLYVVIKW